MKTNKTSDEIIDIMINNIANGTWKEGDLLPGERMLSEEYNVSRALLREALIALQLLGLLKVRQGGKRVVSSFSYRPISTLMAISLQNNPYFDPDLLHFRQVLEIDAVALACEQDDTDRLLNITKQMEEDHVKGEPIAMTLDIAFHQEIFRLSHNIFLIKTSELIEELLKHSVSYNRSKILSNRDYGLVLVHQHQRIALAIKNKNKDLACNAMRNHLQTVNQIEENQ
jgi:GntR family transcriptional repressor for pyruvate dehydrogenase complex